MTKEDAIKIFNTVLCLGKCDCSKDEIEECLKMAIKALETQPSENEKVIRISKGTLKARTGKYVIYDVEWLKTHFNTTEAKIYGQPNEDCISRKAVLDALHSKFADGFDGDKWWNSTHVLDAINKAPSVNPQPSERTEERTETHERDCISRQFMYDMGATCIAARNKDGDLVALGALDILPSVNLQPKAGHWIGHREHCEKLGVIPSGLGVYEWCSNCGHGIDIRDWSRISHSYCPNCGAKMQEVKK